MGQIPAVCWPVGYAPVPSSSCEGYKQLAVQAGWHLLLLSPRSQKALGVLSCPQCEASSALFHTSQGLLHSLLVSAFET